MSDEVWMVERERNVKRKRMRRDEDVVEMRKLY